MTIGIWSCCYITVVHVFTLVVARVLPGFGYALALWTDTSPHVADLRYSVVM